MSKRAEKRAAAERLAVELANAIELISLSEVLRVVAIAMDAEAERIEEEAAREGIMSFAPRGGPTRSAAAMVRRAILVHEGKELPEVFR